MHPHLATKSMEILGATPLRELVDKCGDHGEFEAWCRMLGWKLDMWSVWELEWESEEIWLEDSILVKVHHDRSPNFGLGVQNERKPDLASGHVSKMVDQIG